MCRREGEEIDQKLVIKEEESREKENKRRNLGQRRESRRAIASKC